MAEVSNAELLAVHVYLHGEAVGGGLDAIACKDFTDISAIHFGTTGRLAEGKALR
jgi:hypothetical protein